ncbi:hypothetical protein AGMMS50268_03950 [Spirochaetia bacterium]|nr:hypothetical protein AGMMS50268_03950 [Spirochaetia bacterium]
MERAQKRRVVRPPAEFCWVEDFGEIERLGKIHAKLEAMTDCFSRYDPTRVKEVDAATVYGFWYILEDICRELAVIIKLDYWTGEAGPAVKVDQPA